MYTRADRHLQQILVDNFARFTAALNKLFAGGSPGDFAPLMVTIGASILACWKNGVPPKFTDAPPPWSYTERVAARFGDYLTNRAHLYRLEQRWVDAPFWRQRAMASQPAPIRNDSATASLQT